MLPLTESVGSAARTVISCETAFSSTVRTPFSTLIHLRSVPRLLILSASHTYQIRSSSVSSTFSPSFWAAALIVSGSSALT